MPNIQTVTDPNEIDLLPEKRALLREQYTEMLAAMKVDKQARTLTPGEGETLRKLRVNITRSANDLDMDVEQRETRSGALCVYLSPPKAERVTTKSRKAAQKKASTNGTANSEPENGTEAEAPTLVLPE